MTLADKRFKAKDKIVQKMTREGLVSENLRTGEKKPVEQEKTASAEQTDVEISVQNHAVENSGETPLEIPLKEASNDVSLDDTEDFEEEIPKRRSTAKQSSDFYRRQQAEQKEAAAQADDSIGFDAEEQPAKKSRLSFDDEQGGIVRGAGLGIKKAAKKGAAAAAGYAHNKVHQAEKENSGVEAAHKSEEAAEWTQRYFKGKQKSKKTKETSARSEKKQQDQAKKSRLQFSEDEGGEGKQAESAAKPKNSAKKTAKEAAAKTADAKFYQKKRYKDAYAAAKHGKRTGEEVSKQAVTATNTISMQVKAFVQESVTRNKSVWLTVGVLALLFLLIFGSFSSCSAIMQGVGSTFVGTTYPSKDTDMLKAEEEYLRLEEELNKQINQIESTHPGYDEYRYALDEIGHDPYQLISHLTAVYEQFTFGQVKKVIEALFKQQYILKVWETIEIRTRTETRTSYDSVTGESYTYEVEVEYEYKILNIQLKNEGFDKIARKNMSRDETGRYDAYNLTYGNRPELFGAGSPTYSGRTVGSIGTGGTGGTSGGYQYDIPAEALSDEKFARMIAEAEKYLGRAYVWGGSSPSTGFDCSGFVSWVINNSGNGWNVGRQTAEGLRQSTTYVSADQAQPGDLIFFEKTYNTAGASHVGIYVGDGMMIHCGDPISYTSIYSNYWQSHFLGFGRIS